MKLTLNPGEKKQIPLEHRFLRVLDASSAFEITVPGVNAFLLRNRQSADLLKPRTVTVLNNNAVIITVEIESSPFNIAEIDAMSISDMPPIEIAPGQAIQTAEVGFPVNANLAVNNFPTEFGVNNFPTEFGVNNFPTEFGVNNFPTAFGVNNFPTAFGVNNFPTEFGVKAKNSLNGLAPVSFDVNAKTIQGNANRKELHIQCKSSNTGLIYLGSNDGLSGLTIEAGQVVVIEITDDLSLYADTLNDAINLAEIV